jgi:N-acetylated-alpha-linked acidic dipeptidase
MDKVGDPGWKYHIASARLWSLMTAHLLEPGVLKMSVVDYASAFYRWIDELGDPKSWSAEVDLTSLTEAVDALAMAAHQFDGVTRSLSLHQPAACNFWSSKKHDLAVRRANKVIIAFERQFYYEQGLDAHNDHHHVIFTPSAWHNSPPAMPGLNKALTNGDWENAKVRTCFKLVHGLVLPLTEEQRWRDILSDKIKDATRLIETYLHETQLAHAPFPSIKKGGSL